MSEPKRTLPPWSLAGVADGSVPFCPCKCHRRDEDDEWAQCACGECVKRKCPIAVVLLGGRTP